MRYYKRKAIVRTFVTTSLFTLFFLEATHAQDKQIEELEQYKSEIAATWRANYINTDVNLTKLELTPSNESASISKNKNEPHQHLNNINHLHSHNAEDAEDSLKPESSVKSAYLIILVYLIGLALISWVLMKKLNSSYRE